MAAIVQVAVQLVVEVAAIRDVQDLPHQVVVQIVAPLVQVAVQQDVPPPVAAAALLAAPPPVVAAAILVAPPPVAVVAHLVVPLPVAAAARPAAPPPVVAVAILVAPPPVEAVVPLAVQPPVVADALQHVLELQGSHVTLVQTLVCSHALILVPKHVHQVVQIHVIHPVTTDAQIYVPGVVVLAALVVLVCQVVMCIVMEVAHFYVNLHVQECASVHAAPHVLAQVLNNNEPTRKSQKGVRLVCMIKSIALININYLLLHNLLDRRNRKYSLIKKKICVTED